MTWKEAACGRRGKEPRTGQGEPRRSTGQGQGGGVGLSPDTLLPSAPQGMGLKGPLLPGPHSPGRSSHGPRNHPRSTHQHLPNLPPLGGLGAPATWEEGITLHPLLTGRSEALRKLWGQLCQPGDTPGLRPEVTFGAAEPSSQRWSFKSN